MDDNVTKAIRERFNSLPSDIQELIMSAHYQDTLIEIGKKYSLTVEQMGILERETTMVMMGLTPTKDFENDLTHELHVDKEKGAQVVKDINEKIFLKIRELLKLMGTPEGEEPSLDETNGSQSTDIDILHNAGIEIISAQNNSAPNPPAAEKPKTDITPVLAQKLTGSFQIPSTKTEHSLGNISNNGDKSLNQTSPSSAPAPIKPVPQIYPPKGDPYREIPE